MLRRRVIPCLDVRGGRLVKGVNFQALRDCGDPVDAAAAYADAGADEIVWLNIAAGEESWRALLAAVERAAERVDVPLTVGGGVGSATQARDLLLAGADKVSCNTAALDRPALVGELAERFGSQCVVVAIDAHRDGGEGWLVRASAASRANGRDALAWAGEAAERGAGELLVTSIDADGTGEGYDLGLLARICRRVRVPVVASGGAGGPAHMVAALRAGAQAALAASIFHDQRFTFADVKREAAAAGLPVRL
jgi:imidazole glycerol-phosphate synthase subunit HisF